MLTQKFIKKLVKLYDRAVLTNDEFIGNLSAEGLDKESIDILLDGSDREAVQRVINTFPTGE